MDNRSANIINNFSPILALKAFYIDSCFKNNSNHNYSTIKIPYIEFNRSLTRSKSGFSRDYKLTWVNELLPAINIYIVVIQVRSDTNDSNDSNDSNNSINTYYLFRIKSKTNKSTKEIDEESIRKHSKILVDIEKVYFFPYSLYYDSDVNGLLAINKQYCFNVLDSACWIDATTLTDDNQEMMDLIRGTTDLVYPAINLPDDKIYNYILTNIDVVPRPRYLVYKCHNRVAGVENIYRRLTDSNSTSKPIKNKDTISKEPIVEEDNVK